VGYFSSDISVNSNVQSTMVVNIPDDMIRTIARLSIASPHRKPWSRCR